MYTEVKSDGKTSAMSSPMEVFNVSGHFHTPYSFSAFDNIGQAITMAKQENVKVLGINDFIVTDGHKEFASLATQNHIFPLFNIEFMGLMKDEQSKGIRINDPGNPGRVYFSGKGLDFPAKPNEEISAVLDKLLVESNRQASQMVQLLSDHLKAIGAPFDVTFEEVKRELAKDLVRERHIAKAVRIKVFEHTPNADERADLFTKIFGGKALKSSLEDINALENEIRSNLLKAGAPAFVPEDQDAFLSFEKIREVILGLGGIPCYPVLLDDAKGNFTEFEANKEQLLKALAVKGVYSIELIPGRNSFEVLKPFVKFFNSHNFVVMLGTEHNTPELIPLTVDCRGCAQLDEELKAISYEGACVIAAHQYLRSRGKPGYVNEAGEAKRNQYRQFVALGNEVIRGVVLA